MDLLCGSFFGDDEEHNDSAKDSAPLPTTSPVPQTIKRKSRVRFSRSTIILQLNELEQLGSTNAFFNFLLAQRIRELGLVGLNYLDVLKSQRLISGKRIWNCMYELAESVRQNDI